MQKEASSPFFTIVTPTLNVEKYLENTLESVSGQSFNNFEHIFIDGYSTDHTLDIIDKYRQGKEYSVRVIKRSPSGISDAFNEGIGNAKGKYIIFLNGDDSFLSPSSLSSVYKILQSNPQIQCLQGRAVLQVSSLKISLSSYINMLTYFFNLSYGCPVCHPNTIMSRELLVKSKGFDRSLKYQMDTDLFHRLRGKVDIYFSDFSLSALRIRKGSSTFKNYFDRIRYWVLFYNRYHSVLFISGILWSLKYFKGLKYIKA